jgi:hypothetical protein
MSTHHLEPFSHIHVRTKTYNNTFTSPISLYQFVLIELFSLYILPFDQIQHGHILLGIFLKIFHVFMLV